MEIKKKAGHFKTKSLQMEFLAKCKKELEKLPYNSQELEKIKDFINKGTEDLKIRKSTADVNFTYIKQKKKDCHCNECKSYDLPPQQSTLKDPISLAKTLVEYLLQLNCVIVRNHARNFQRIKCNQLKFNLANYLIQRALDLTTAIKTYSTLKMKSFYFYRLLFHLTTLK